MFTSCVVLFLVNVYLCGAYNKVNKFYKVSMVSSDDMPRRPALFVHAASPVWDSERQCLFFVDVLERNVHRLDYNSGKIHTKYIEYGPATVVSPVKASARLLVAVRTALYLLDWTMPGDEALRLLSTVDLGQPDNVISEGKADARGRFWTGTRGPQILDDVTPDKATFYSMEQENFVNPRIQLRPTSAVNGITWSPNNSVLYFIDSPTMKVEAFDFDLQRGELSARRTIVDISTFGFEDAVPDGMTIDSQGYLWVAVMFGGAVLHINPDSRQLIYSYKLPVSRVTSVAWGGPNLDELFLTTARDKLDQISEPLGGAIFTIRDTGSHGLPSNAFRFVNADVY